MEFVKLSLVNRLMFLYPNKLGHSLVLFSHVLVYLTNILLGVCHVPDIVQCFGRTKVNKIVSSPKGIARDNAFVMMEPFCILTVVVTLIYAWDKIS